MQKGEKMEKETIPGRVYAYGCLLKKEIRGFSQVSSNTPDYRLVEFLEDPTQAETLLQRRLNLIQELIKV